MGIGTKIWDKYVHQSILCDYHTPPPLLRIWYFSTVSLFGSSTTYLSLHDSDLFGYKALFYLYLYLGSYTLWYLPWYTSGGQQLPCKCIYKHWNSSGSFKYPFSLTLWFVVLYISIVLLDTIFVLFCVITIKKWDLVQWY